MGVFSEKARTASLKARKRNALLRRQGKLPPTKNQLRAMAKKNGDVTSIPLDAIPTLPKKYYKKRMVKAGASDVGLRVLALLERLL